MRFSLRRVAYRFGPSLWHPVLVRIVGQATVSERLAEIEGRHPDLAAWPSRPADAPAADRQLIDDIYVAMAEIRATAAAGMPRQALVP